MNRVQRASAVAVCRRSRARLRQCDERGAVGWRVGLGVPIGVRAKAVVTGQCRMDQRPGVGPVSAGP